MNKTFRHYIIQLSLFSLLVFIFPVLIKKNTELNFLIQHTIALQCTFFCTYLFSHKSLINSRKSSPNKFIRIFMLNTALKMFVFLVVLICALFLINTNQFSFAISFLILYLLYAVFELYLILKFFKQKKDN